MSLSRLESEIKKKLKTCAFCEHRNLLNHECTLKKEEMPYNSIPCEKYKINKGLEELYREYLEDILS